MFSRAGVACLLVVLLAFGGVSTAFASAKAPAPSDIALKKATKLATELFDTDFAQSVTPQEKAALARKLLQTGLEEAPGTVDRYALLMLARDQAVAAGDTVTAYKALDAIDQSFQVDGLAMKTEMMTALAKSLRTLQDRGDFVGRAISLIGESRAADRLDLAVRLADLAQANAASVNEPLVLKKVVEAVRGVHEEQMRRAVVTRAEAVLHDNPGDAEANLTVGKFRCLVKADWAGGLPMLAASSDLTFAAMAKKELTHPTEPEAQLAVADGWWDLAQKQPASVRDPIVAHAVALYRDLQPRVVGLERVKVEMRLKQAGSAPAEAQAAEPLLDSMYGGIVRKEPDGSIVVANDDPIISAKLYRPPVTFGIIAMTDSTNIRIGYAADEIIFNWEMNRSELRVDGGPVAGRHKAGAGSVPVNTWVEIKLTVALDSMTIWVDGQERYHESADFSKISQHLKIWATRGALVHVKSVTVSKP